MKVFDLFLIMIIALIGLEVINGANTQVDRAITAVQGSTQDVSRFATDVGIAVHGDSTLSTWQDMGNILTKMTFF